MSAIILIPARYASSRYPGKPLVVLKGADGEKTLIQRTWETGMAVPGVDRVLVATDDDRIADAVQGFGGEVVMTSEDCANGTERCADAIARMGVSPEIVVNLQGDAPFTPPGYITAIIEAGRSTDLDAVTPVVQMSWDDLDELRLRKQDTPFSGTTCVLNAQSEALWFSKNLLPAMRKEANLREAGPMSPVWRHIGLYGYKRSALEAFVSLKEGHYESLEGLEQLRFLDNGMRIQAVKVPAAPSAMWGIDTPQDAAHAEALIARNGEPLAAYLR